MCVCVCLCVCAVVTCTYSGNHTRVSYRIITCKHKLTSQIESIPTMLPSLSLSLPPLSPSLSPPLPLPSDKDSGYTSRGDCSWQQETDSRTHMDAHPQLRSNNIIATPINPLTPPLTSCQVVSPSVRTRDLPLPIKCPLKLLRKNCYNGVRKQLMGESPDCHVTTCHVITGIIGTRR